MTACGSAWYRSGMIGPIGILLLFTSALLIAVADALIKKVSASGSLFAALLDPWMLVICLLYFIQIVIVTYIFIQKGELAVYGNLFIIFYSVMMILLGIFAFGENITFWQGVGIVLALGGAVLINGF